jgi:pyridoxine/pyridoxamine 5'-phosphate oxidase
VPTSTNRATVQVVLRWRYYISWDNAAPPTFRTMYAALRAIGTVRQLATKTSVALAPKKGKGWSHVRHAIATNLHSKKGNAFYVNLRSGKARQINNRLRSGWIPAP